ncbi:hypothetical protein GBA63_20580 [Rubrobacter tropicus]|uniref:DUF1440 domain-containing protein n=1 Tax=Rubrobacter tropicus TaxID=2653851 RepID=A0A6G8QE94_9ACTN|nr:hypothetical protein [Rubrobacter tropicus]QIN84773.1 hypothetical protein GBA63_20580 [Rubrobacter tropicus]
MDARGRILAGALGGAGGTLVLSALRGVLKKTGVVFDTAPTQVVDRVEEVFAADGLSPNTRRALAATAHVSYGVGAGVAFGLLRREGGGAGEEAAVGSSLGVLAWGVGWSSWLPLAGVHSPPWEQQTVKVLLPVLDHAVFGAAWGLIFSALTRHRP